jgi:hypothetical protein
MPDYLHLGTDGNPETFITLHSVVCAVYKPESAPGAPARVSESVTLFFEGGQTTTLYGSEANAFMKEFRRHAEPKPPKKPKASKQKSTGKKPGTR